MNSLFASYRIPGLLTGATLSILASYLKTPRSGQDLAPNIYHGTTSDLMPNIQLGETFKVRKHLFFTENPTLAKAYATGEGFSAFRPGQSISGSPLILRLTPVNRSETTWKIGVFGFCKYFCNNTELKVEEILRFPPISTARQKELANSRHF